VVTDRHRSVICQGEIWWSEVEDQRRPVLVVTRDEAIAVLHAVVVAPVTRTIRGIPTEIPLGSDEGITGDCVATFDNLRPVRTSSLTDRAGVLAPSRRHEICAALRALSDC
jgi:mRNA interferase MazF